jgi:membrane-bound lytic murein transglycosylase D
LAEDQREYEENVELLSTGEEIDEEKLATIADRLRTGAVECVETAGCNWMRFWGVIDALLEAQATALMRQASRVDSLSTDAEEEHLERELGTSPFVSAMPEIGTTVSLLRGTDLGALVQINGPVKAALDDWLTWMRPMLMDSYENYQYLKSQIAPIYQEAGLPEALLFGIVATETRGRVHSTSRAGAVGLLQFVRYTGRRYGLKVVDGFDMRLDPTAATKANVAYLNDLFGMLNNNLEKALAAYNTGENRIRRLDRTYKGASLWDNRYFYRLPRETRDYVPRILAAAWLFLHPETYNLQWPTLQTDTTQIVAEKDIALGELTICLGQIESRNGWFRTLRNLNPRLDPGERVKAGETIAIPSVLVPYYEQQCVDGEYIERARLLHDANYPYGEMIRYVVQRGDTLGRIAARFRCVSVRELAALNNIRAPRYVIRVGQRLRIPNCG